MRRIIVAVMIVSLLPSCKKDTAPADTYTITGIHNIDFTAGLAETMAISLALLPGQTEDTVALQVDGLPNDLNATFSTTSGKPPFSTVLTVKRQETSGGTHYAHIVVISRNGKRKAYPLKVVVPPLSNIRFDGRYYTIQKILIDDTASKLVRFIGEDIDIRLSLPDYLPYKAGTYTYRLSAARPGTGTAMLKVWDGDRPFTTGYNGTSEIALDLDSTRTITKVYLPDMEVSTETEPILYRTLGINYSK